MILIRVVMKVLVFSICLLPELQLSYAEKENSESELCKSVKTSGKVPLIILSDGKLLSTLGWPKYKGSPVKIVNQFIEFETCT